MSIRALLSRQRPTFSFEFFPPKTAETSAQLFSTVAELERLKPSFVSVTYGAGGSTRDLTHDLVVRIRQETSLPPVPHLTCVNHDEGEVRLILERYARAGISGIMALRGDPPRTGGTPPPADRRQVFRHATDLVRFIRRAEPTLGNGPLAIGVAGYPEGHPDTPNRLVEMDHLKAKVDEGADFIITQLFFDNRDFLDFRDRCSLAGVRTPIIAGIMPITSLAGMKRMAELALGSRFPASLLRAVARAGGNDEAVKRVGVHWATEQCRDLLDHRVAGIHFYTLNRSTATREVYASLGVEDSEGLAGPAQAPWTV
jgi:methylenetetrahydrofolate reductase (NADPH)